LRPDGFSCPQIIPSSHIDLHYHLGRWDQWRRGDASRFAYGPSSLCFAYKLLCFCTLSAAYIHFHGQKVLNALQEDSSRRLRCDESWALNSCRYWRLIRRNSRNASGMNRVKRRPICLILHGAPLLPFNPAISFCPRCRDSFSVTGFIIAK
jgi:hypothetical protein